MENFKRGKKMFRHSLCCVQGSFEKYTFSEVCRKGPKRSYLCTVKITGVVYSEPVTSGCLFSIQRVRNFNLTLYLNHYF